jgi:hypothetical protein
MYGWEPLHHRFGLCVSKKRAGATIGVPLRRDRWSSSYSSNGSEKNPIYNFQEKYIRYGAEFPYQLAFHVVY